MDTAGYRLNYYYLASAAAPAIPAQSDCPVMENVRRAAASRCDLANREW
jgi:hypothetical protein